MSNPAVTGPAALLEALPEIRIVAPDEVTFHPSPRGLRGLWARAVGALPTQPQEWLARGAGTTLGGVATLASAHLGCAVSLGLAYALPALPAEQMRNLSYGVGGLSIALGAYLIYKGFKKDSCCNTFGEAAGTKTLKLLMLAGGALSVVNGYNAITTDPHNLLLAARIAAATGQPLFSILGDICSTGSVGGLTP